MECLCSGQYEKVGFPFFPRKLKSVVKFHFFTYPRKNDHACLPILRLQTFSFSKNGNVTGFPMVDFPCVCGGGRGGGGVGRGTSHQN